MLTNWFTFLLYKFLKVSECVLVCRCVIKRLFVRVLFDSVHACVFVCEYMWCVYFVRTCEHNSLRFLVFVYPLLTLGVLQRLMGD